MEIVREPQRVPRNREQSRDSFDGFDLGPVQRLGFLGGARKRQGRKLVEFQVLSAIVDGLIVLGMTLFLSSFSILIMKLKGDLNQFLGVFILVFVWFQFCYLVLLRAYLGHTLGEKTFNIRLGKYHERLQLFYPLRVIFRTLLILLTGIIILPLFSWLLKKDLSGKITGLKIISLI
ncbi:MAG: RDD family protein [Deltaproteobacteria bacterium]|nr:RDD family protein [Deltaproteobacteria bacterium]